MQCPIHNNREAIGACVKFEDFFCKNCLVRNYCKEYAIALINQTKSQNNSISTKSNKFNNSDCNTSNKFNNKIDNSYVNDFQNSNEGHQQKENNSTTIKLDSPDNFPNELRKYNIMYIITVILFAIFLGKYITVLFAALLGLTVAFIVVNFIINFKVGTLRTTKYYLPGNFSKDEIVALITQPLTSLNMNVENLSDSIRVKHNGMHYNIYLNSEDSTFTAWVNRPLLSSALLGRSYIYIYLKAIFSMPLIIYTIQSEIEKTLNLDIKRFINKFCI